MKEIDLLIPHGGDSQTPKRIVVHTMGEYIFYKNNFTHAVAFLNDYGLSAHILVSPSGELLRCRPDDKIAWHAKDYNTDSLGIEFLIKGQYDYLTFPRAIKESYLTKAQYSAGVDMVNHWQRLYKIESVDRHSDLSPERKADPGDGFPWDDFKKRIELWHLIGNR